MEKNKFSEQFIKLNGHSEVQEIERKENEKNERKQRSSTVAEEEAEMEAKKTKSGNVMNKRDTNELGLSECSGKEKEAL